jgi:alpha-1,3-rhamnosyltransferase
VNNNPKFPLVSIIVITYNSANYVLETLESAKTQTYPEIELIISDDGSKDETIEICQRWADENNLHFVEIKILSVKKNTGIPSNCNRGISASNGEWIKLIAGDDILETHCISNFTNFLVDNPSALVITSQQESFFTDNNNNKIYVNKRPEVTNSNSSFYKNDSNAVLQLRYLANRKVLIAGPTYFINAELLKNINGFNEKYKLLEDYPLFIKILKNNIPIFYLDKITVFYRISNNSVSSSNLNKIYPKYYKDWYKHLFNEVFNILSCSGKIDLIIEFIVYFIIKGLGNRGKFLNYLKKHSSKIKFTR